MITFNIQLGKMSRLVPWRSKKVLQNIFVQSIPIESHLSRYLHDTLNARNVIVIIEKQ